MNTYLMVPILSRRIVLTRVELILIVRVTTIRFHCIRSSNTFISNTANPERENGDKDDGGNPWLGLLSRPKTGRFPQGGGNRIQVLQKGCCC